jgi:hypothetical protein
MAYRPLVCKDAETCECGGRIESTEEWLGEDENGIGRFRILDQCTVCGLWSQEIVKE